MAVFRRARAGLIVYPPWIQIRDVSAAKFSSQSCDRRPRAIDSLPSQDSLPKLPLPGSKIKIRTSSCNKAQLALLHDEVRILIFDDPAEQEERKCPKFCFAQLDSNNTQFSRSCIRFKRFCSFAIAGRSLIEFFIVE